MGLKSQTQRAVSPQTFDANLMKTKLVFFFFINITESDLSLVNTSGVLYAAQFDLMLVTVVFHFLKPNPEEALIKSSEFSRVEDS